GTGARAAGSTGGAEHARPHESGSTDVQRRSPVVHRRKRACGDFRGVQALSKLRRPPKWARQKAWFLPACKAGRAGTHGRCLSLLSLVADFEGRVDLVLG